MALTDFVDNLAPPWSKGDATKHWWNVFRLAAVLIDGIIEGVYTGRLAGMPNAVQIPGIPGYGGFEDARSLDYLGQDLQVFQGLAESPPDYAFMLRHAQDPGKLGWGSAGLVVGVLEQLAAVLTVSAGGFTPAPAPLMRIVNLHGDWWTRHTDGSYTLHRVDGSGLNYPAPTLPSAELDPTQATPNIDPAHVWDWGSTSSPPNPIGTSAGDWWLIVYTPVNGPYGTALDGTFADPGTCSDMYNDPSPQPVPNLSPWAGTVGTNTPRALVELVRHVVGQRQTAGWPCVWIIFASDPSSFNPDGSSMAGSSRTAYPDGNWGWHTVYDAGTNAQVIARLQTAEYWQGPTMATNNPPGT